MPRNQIEFTPRQRQILECINREGITTVNALGQEASCSTSSVRRDLRTLDETGLIKRIRGGAESLSVATVTSHLYRLQKSSHWIEKSKSAEPPPNWLMIMKPSPLIMGQRPWR